MRWQAKLLFAATAFLAASAVFWSIMASLIAFDYPPRFIGFGMLAAVGFLWFAALAWAWETDAAVRRLK